MPPIAPPDARKLKLLVWREQTTIVVTTSWPKYVPKPTDYRDWGINE